MTAPSIPARPRLPARGGAVAGLGAFLLLAGLPVLAREPIIPQSELPGLGPADPRRPVDAAAMPWAALGRVQTELGTRCTGTLVGPRTVLTAAHCLVAPRTGEWVRPASIHFLLGYRQGAWKGEGRGLSFVTGPGFDPRTRSPASADWALVTLAAPLPAAPSLSLLPENSPPGTPLLLGGYQQDRPEVLMADSACRVLGPGRYEGRLVLMHDCAGTRGASGAPLLARRAEGGWGVAAIAVAVARSQAQGIAVPAAFLRQALERPGG